MKEQVGLKSIKDSCEGRERSRRARDKHSPPVFLGFRGDLEGYSEVELKQVHRGKCALYQDK